MLPYTFEQKIGCVERHGLFFLIVLSSPLGDSGFFGEGPIRLEFFWGRGRTSPSKSNNFAVGNVCDFAKHTNFTFYNVCNICNISKHTNFTLCNVFIFSNVLLFLIFVKCQKLLFLYLQRF